MLAFHLARFKVDATPPNGHSLCGGWIKPVVGVDDPLWLRGVVLQGAGLPIVLAALDWTGVMDESHRLWTEALAEAAHTTPDRVALHCVHQHNAPFIDREGNALLRKANATPLLYDEAFVDDLVKRAAAAVRESLTAAKPVTHIRAGQAEVHEVASNRRVIGPDGKIRFTRGSATLDPVARAEPVGTIDPILKSVGFFQGDRPLARLYYYTTHPMSYYGDGRVSSDFAGLARQQRAADEPDTFHVYFTGAAGNVTAGKFNDGNHANRVTLAHRIHAAMKAADEHAQERAHPLESAEWITAPFRFAARSDLDLDKLKAIVADPKESVVNRNRTAMTCGWLMRVASRRPILLSKLELAGGTLLHLPAETFVEYQLHAQGERPDTLLATAAYGDGGPWYIPLERSFAEGGYEPSVAGVSTTSETPYRKAISDLLKKQA
ncbi:hypothetical protein [Singulisphaera acidiphila]|uniref:Neutral/alkaline non-lysosomal ceramidase n=1 Tax=Singulisphaera acidiphila (strain ATCC BAA-1392 / DSM 18658 / VKM B-2454 / MOB10) TaxID=886293 RepID=L0DEQ9_SINAD|nr:hypothetical protein [Singulisphaera acidiphila]AGA27303.1 hypothetical protein Sinac_3020 [Singulisphaera acidiphila DSM 18658]